MNDQAAVPICGECGAIIWSNEESNARLFLWYEGDENEDPLDPDLARGAMTHGSCAEAFGARLAAAQAARKAEGDQGGGEAE